jgi:hypothetical protein
MRRGKKCCLFFEGVQELLGGKTKNFNIYIYISKQEKEGKMERGIHYKVSLFDLEIYFHAT